MVVEVFQGTELKLRAWMTSWYEVLVWLCLSWCGCACLGVVVRGPGVTGGFLLVVVVLGLGGMVVVCLESAIIL